MKKSLFYSKKFAYFATAVIIALSVILGGARSLNSERVKAVELFETGKETDRNIFQIAGDFFVNLLDGENSDTGGVLQCVRERAETARDIADIAEKHLGADNEDVRMIKDAYNVVGKTKSIDEIYDYNRQISSAADSIHRKLKAAGVSDTALDSSFNDLNYKEDRIKSDRYNSKAKKYNNTLNDFPANIIRKLQLVDYLPDFS